MIEDKDSYIENIKSNRAAELLMLNHIEMVFSEGDNDTETCAEAIRIAEQDARDRAIKAFTYFCRWHHTDMHDISNCPHNEECGNRCGYFIKFMDTYNK